MIKGVDFKNVIAAGDITIGDIIVQTTTFNYDELFNKLRASPDYPSFKNNLPLNPTLNLKGLLHLILCVFILFSLYVSFIFRIDSPLFYYAIIVLMSILLYSSYLFWKNIKAKKYTTFLPVEAIDVVVLDVITINEIKSYQTEKGIVNKSVTKRKIEVCQENGKRRGFEVSSDMIIQPGDIGIIYISNNNLIGYRYLYKENIIDSFTI